MCNYLPWGSGKFEELISSLKERDLPLLKRMLQFSEDLNLKILKDLKPDLIIIPFSLGRNKLFDSVFESRLAHGSSKTAQSYKVLTGKRTFNFYVDSVIINDLSVTCLYVPHPSSLRLGPGLPRVC